MTKFASLPVSASFESVGASAVVVASGEANTIHCSLA